MKPSNNISGPEKRLGLMLYVEDDPNDALFMQRAFEQVGLPFTLTIVNDGEEAIDYLTCAGAFAGQHNPPPCLVLLDLNLPGKTGFEVLRWIRAQAQFEALVVVVYTSSAQAQDRELAAKLGATDYCVKPANAREIPEVLKQINERWLSPGEELF